MKITQKRLKKIIEEELRGVVEAISEKEKKEDNTERKRRQRKKDELRFGDESLRQLAQGIVSEENPFHNADGEWSSEADAKSYSTYFKNGIRKRLKGSLTDKHDSGRGRKKDGQGKYRIKDNSKKWEESKRGDTDFVSLTLRELAELVESCVREFISEVEKKHRDEEKIIEDGKPTLDQLCIKKGFRKFDSLLASMNAMANAAKGDLGKR